jgi:fatty acid desaturase
MDEQSQLATPSNAYGLRCLLTNLAPLLTLYAAAPWLADRSLVLAWVLVAPAGLLLYRLTMVMHDCGHSSLFTSKRANRFVGWMLACATGVDFDRFRDRHWEHHRNYGLAGDPQGFHYLTWPRLSLSARVWHLVKPLLGLNLPCVYGESLLAPANLIRAARTGQILALVVVQAATLALITGAGRHWSLALLPFVGAVTVGLFLSQLRGIAEHGVASRLAPTRHVRSHSGDFMGRVLLYDVNFNFHEEHHEFPGIPSCNLPRLALRGGAGNAVRPIMWRTLSTLVQAR